MCLLRLLHGDTAKNREFGRKEKSLQVQQPYLFCHGSLSAVRLVRLVRHVLRIDLSTVDRESLPIGVSKSFGSRMKLDARRERVSSGFLGFWEVVGLGMSREISRFNTNGLQPKSAGLQPKSAGLDQSGGHIKANPGDPKGFHTKASPGLVVGFGGL